MKQNLREIAAAGLLRHENGRSRLRYEAMGLPNRF
jgi:hypothetical protein